MVDWKVYYADGFRIDGDVGTILRPERRRGVLIIVHCDKDHEWDFLHSKDYYLLFHDGHFLGVDQFGLMDNLLESCEEIRYVLSGRTVYTPHYEAMLKRATEECDPPKTAWRQGERR